MATGKDMSELLPPVVKNVASKNVEVRAKSRNTSGRMTSLFL